MVAKSRPSSASIKVRQIFCLLQLSGRTKGLAADQLVFMHQLYKAMIAAR